MNDGRVLGWGSCAQLLLILWNRYFFLEKYSHKFFLSHIPKLPRQHFFVQSLAFERQSLCEREGVCVCEKERVFVIFVSFDGTAPLPH